MKRKGRKEEGAETFGSCSHLLLIYFAFCNITVPVSLTLLETPLAPQGGGHTKPPPQYLGSKTRAILNYLKLEPNVLFAGKGRNEIANSVHSLEICLVGFPINFFFMVLPKVI